MYEDFVTFEQARIISLMDSPFETATTHAWLKGKNGTFLVGRPCACDEGDVVYPAPTLYQVQSWLRIKKGLFIDIVYQISEDWPLYGLFVYNNKGATLSKELPQYTDYGDALKASITKALELLTTDLA